MTVCKNCSSSFQGVYCNQCGQRDNTGHFTFRELVGNFVAQVFTLELPVLHTFRELFSRPGRFCREYIQGKRQPFVPPIQFFLLLSGVHLLIRVVTKFDPIANQYKAQGITLPTSHSAHKSEFIGHFISENLNNFFFILIFIFAFFSWLFFRKSKFTLIENIVFSFYAIAAYTVFPSMAIFLAYIHPKLYYFMYLFIVSYLTWSLIGFHQTNIGVGILKGILVSVISYVFYILCASVIGVCYYYWFR